MKNIIQRTVIFILIIVGCNAKTNSTTFVSYDQLIIDVLKIAKVKATAILFNPNDMEIKYIYNKKMAIGQAFEPGSIFKLVTSIAYFNKKKPFEYNSNGKFLVYPNDRTRPKRKIGSRTRRIRRGDYFPDGKISPRGTFSIVEALAGSSNSYFLSMIRRIPFAKWYKTSKAFGFGEITGIKFPVINNQNTTTQNNENQTTNSNSTDSVSLNEEIIEEIKGHFVFKTRFNKLMCAIGLGPRFKVTPIQFAVFLGALFNDGKIMKPYIKPNKPKLVRTYKLPKYMDLIYKGMLECTKTGTGMGFVVPHIIKTYSKTGSTMNHKHPYTPNGWFVGLVELKNTRLGFVVFVKDRISVGAKHLAAILLRQYIINNNLSN